MKQQSRKKSVPTNDVITIVGGRRIFRQFRETSKKILYAETDLVHFHLSI